MTEWKPYTHSIDPHEMCFVLLDDGTRTVARKAFDCPWDDLRLYGSIRKTVTHTAEIRLPETPPKPKNPFIAWVDHAIPAKVRCYYNCPVIECDVNKIKCYSGEYVAANLIATSPGARREALDIIYDIVTFQGHKCPELTEAVYILGEEADR